MKRVMIGLVAVTLASTGAGARADSPSAPTGMPGGRLYASAAPVVARSAASMPDDPKEDMLSADVALSAKAPSRPHANPRFKLSYRMMSLPNLDRTALQMHGGQIDVYPLSRRWFRLGIEAQGGAGEGALDATTASLWYATLGLSAGLQFPWRVTPFIEGRASAGLLGGQMLGQQVLTWTYQGGVEGGVELYVVSRVYLSASVGWVRPFYRGIDYVALRTPGQAEVPMVELSADTWTMKVGIGL